MKDDALRALAARVKELQQSHLLQACTLILFHASRPQYADTLAADAATQRTCALQAQITHLAAVNTQLLRRYASALETVCSYRAVVDGPSTEPRPEGAWIEQLEASTEVVPRRMNRSTSPQALAQSEARNRQLQDEVRKVMRADGHAATLTRPSCRSS